MQRKLMQPHLWMFLLIILLSRFAAVFASSADPRMQELASYAVFPAAGVAYLAGIRMGRRAEEEQIPFRSLVIVVGVFIAIHVILWIWSLEQMKRGFL